MKDELNYAYFLQGGDLRSIGRANALVEHINSQEQFDALFGLLSHEDRKIAMRAADAVEKVTVTKPEFLKPHKKNLRQLFTRNAHIELKWHLAQLAPRVQWTKSELPVIWKTLTSWCNDSTESKIVRVNALQSLHDIASTTPSFRNELLRTAAQLEQENIPSINARLRKLKLKAGLDA